MAIKNSINFSGFRENSDTIPQFPRKNVNIQRTI